MAGRIPQKIPKMVSSSLLSQAIFAGWIQLAPGQSPIFQDDSFTVHDPLTIYKLYDLGGTNRLTNLHEISKGMSLITYIFHDISIIVTG
jgi:hypothetical protein